jgi:type II secretory ATPase GspE/PulE/Tfp pilus assembly ATPase PilB-like protein
MIAHRRSPSVNIVTIEDPIEYQVPGVNQVQVDSKAGLTFARSLRAILRQDPDIILVGEIRDLETAEVAFQAALTGHLVFSTLHTSTAVAAVERLIDLGVSPLLITAATSLVIAQRLLRRTCQACRVPCVPPPALLRKLGIDPGGEFFHGRGCGACEGTGYAGRIGVFEVLRLTPRIKELVRARATEAKLATAARRAVTQFLLEDAVGKVHAGITTVEEVARVLRIERANETRRVRFLGESKGSA